MNFFLCQKIFFTYKIRKQALKTKKMWQLIWNYTIFFSMWTAVSSKTRCCENHPSVNHGKEKKKISANATGIQEKKVHIRLSLFHKFIPWAGLGFLVDWFLPADHMFDTPPIHYHKTIHHCTLVIFPYTPPVFLCDIKHFLIIKVLPMGAALGDGKSGYQV